MRNPVTTPIFRKEIIRANVAISAPYTGPVSTLVWTHSGIVTPIGSGESFHIQMWPDQSPVAAGQIISMTCSVALPDTQPAGQDIYSINLYCDYALVGNCNWGSNLTGATTTDIFPAEVEATTLIHPGMVPTDSWVAAYDLTVTVSYLHAPLS